MTAHPDSAMTTAERELRKRIVDVLQVATGGPVLGGVLVDSIHSYGMAEDNKTLMIMIELADGDTAVISVCPGSPISAQVVI